MNKYETVAVIVLILIGALGVIDIFFLRGGLGVWISQYFPWNWKKKD